MDYSISFVFIVYLIGLLGLGVWASRRTHNLADYMLGGRTLGSTVTALSAGASDMSGWLLLGLPGAAYASGVNQVWIAVGLVIGAYLNWRFVAAPLRRETVKYSDSLTLPDFFHHRFNDTSGLLRLISALVILLFFTFYTASGLVSGALLFESGFGLNYTTALWVGGGIIVAYTFIGGFLAVSWTDLVQGLLMLLALIVVPLVTINQIGGFDVFQTRLYTLSAAHTDYFAELSVLGIISLLAWGLGYFGQPHILARFMAIDNEQHVPRARRIGMTWMVLTLVGAMFSGLAGFVYFADAPLTDAEHVFLQLSQVLFNPWVAGILLAAILSAIMSTIDSQLLVASGAVTDVYRAYSDSEPTDKNLLWLGRIAVLVIAVIAMWLAQNRDSSVLDLVAYAWAGFGAAFGPLILFSLFWPRTDFRGALAGIISGAFMVVAWKQLSNAGVIPFSLYEIVPAFVVSSLMIVAFSRGKR